ncbi:type 4a pilus biogenesis protein PilO [Patescibacteria group bacterium]|nr:type 4a pilus biogenesis protein PilO [Patescibacteria group bacterium]
MNLSEKLSGRTSYGQYYTRMKMILNRPSAKVSGLATLTVFTVVFFTFFAVLPTFKTIASLKREIEDAKNTEAKLQQKIHSLDQAETLFTTVAPNLNILNQVLPSEPEFERLAWQLHWLANKNQLTLISGSISEFEPTFVPVTLTLKGNYLAIKAFMADLNRLDRLIEVEETTINSKSVRLSGDSLTANLKLKAYYLSSSPL